MDIKNIYDAVIFTSAALTLRDAILDAIAKKANLRSANLSSADLSSANLRSAVGYSLPEGWKVNASGVVVPE